MFENLSNGENGTLCLDLTQAKTRHQANKVADRSRQEEDCGILMRTLFLLAQPLCVVWMLLGLSTTLFCWRRRWKDVAAPGAAWLILTVTTCTPLASLLIAELEDRHTKVQISELPLADVIVCLGGGAEPSDSEPSGIHLKSSGDRLTTALALLAAKKAPVLLVGGGGYLNKGEVLSEADPVIRVMRTLTGESGILSLGVCKDTHDEAAKVAAWLKKTGGTRVLLVTSAYHMPRAAGTFQKSGISFEAVPCDFLSSVNRVGDLHWLHLPHSEAFSLFNTFFHELAGLFLYKHKGWI